MLCGLASLNGWHWTRMFEKNQLAPIRMDLPFMYLVSEMTLQSQLTRSNCSRRGVTRAFFNSNETALR